MAIVARRLRRASARVHVPRYALEAGYSRLTLYDDFTSIHSIDTTNSGAAGYTWYVKRPYGYPALAADEYVVENSVLTISQANGYYANWGLATIHPTTKQGFSWKFGYAEARMRFDPSKVALSDGWPAFWATSTTNSVDGTPNPRSAELDIFEYMNEKFNGGMHDWYGVGLDYSMGPTDGSHVLPNVDFSQWHTYAALWQPGNVTWLFDGEPLYSQRYGAESVPAPNTPGNPAGTFAVLDQESPGETLILGCGKNWPIEIDWVHVWQ